MADTPNASGEPDELYLDAAATEPVTRNVIEAMMPFMTDAYANPASVHQPGKTAARALDAARASFAAGLGARPDDVIFTSGGTESDNLPSRASPWHVCAHSACSRSTVLPESMTSRPA